MTKLTIEDSEISVTIKCHEDEMTISEVIEKLFIPALNGMGYTYVTIEDIAYTGCPKEE